jgi:hypothetical protein
LPATVAPAGAANAAMSAATARPMMILFKRVPLPL